MKRLQSLPVRPAALLLAGALLASPAGAVTITALPSTQDVETGETASVSIEIGDLGGEIVSAYDFDLLYDPTVLLATEVVFTSQLGDELLFEVLDDFDLGSPGVVDFAQISLLSDDALFALQGGDAVVVASIHFDAVAAGTSDLSFHFDAVNDVKGRDAAILPIAATNGSIRVHDPDATAPIPEPAAALVFGAGLLLVRVRLRASR